MPRINIDVPDEVHQACKLEAVKTGVPLKDFYTQALKEAL